MVRGPSMIGAPVVYDYPEAAISCCFNGRRTRGIARIVRADGSGWLALDNGVRVRESEIVLRGVHTFEPDPKVMYGCAICGFNDGAEIHSRAANSHE